MIKSVEEWRLLRTSKSFFFTLTVQVISGSKHGPGLRWPREPHSQKKSPSGCAEPGWSCSAASNSWPCSDAAPASRPQTCPPHLSPSSLPPTADAHASCPGTHFCKSHKQNEGGSFSGLFFKFKLNIFRMPELINPLNVLRFSSTPWVAMPKKIHLMYDGFNRNKILTLLLTCLCECQIWSQNYVASS